MLSPTDQLLYQLKQSNIVLFIGAGVSMNAGLPGWADLVKPLAIQSDSHWPESSKDLTSIHFLDTLQFFESKFGRNQLIQHFRNSLSPDILVQSDVHGLLTKLSAQMFFTTNYDNLLEQAFQSIGQSFSTVVSEIDLAYRMDKGVQIIKLCGDLMQPESMVITHTDFNTYADRHSRILSLLQTVLEYKSVLFLGYGLNDPFINQVWDGISLTFGQHRHLGFGVVIDPNEQTMDSLQNRRIVPIILEAGSKGSKETFTKWLLRLVDAL